MEEKTSKNSVGSEGSQSQSGEESQRTVARESEPASNEGSPTNNEVLTKPKKKKRHHVLRNVIIILVIVVVLAIAAFLFLLFRGAIAPADVAAKYDTLSYLPEEEVTSYVETYRTQMGYADSDEAWAEFLGENGLTPDLMRYATIRQLIIDKEVERKAAQHGLSVDESELDSYVEEMKDSLTFGSDEIWNDTLAMYGTTDEEVRTTYAHSLLENELFQEEVPVPSVTDAEIFDYLAAYYPDGLKAKHIYYLTMQVEDGEDELEALGDAQQIREMIASEPDLTPEVFADYVAFYCTDDEVVERSGANGWSVDMADYSENYQTTVDNTKKGQVSKVFREEGEDGTVAFSIVWIDEVAKLPAISDEEKDESQEDKEAYVSTIPQTLKDYFSDCTAQVKWDSDCQDYLGTLYDDSNPVLYPVAGVPSYYVDMSDVEIIPQGEEATSDSEEATSEDEGEEAAQGTDSSSDTEQENSEG